MYICRECGAIFTEPDVVRYLERHGEFQEPRCNDFCPECGSEEYEEAVRCSECGDYCYEENVYSGMCEACVKEALDADSFFRWSLDGAKETDYSTFEDFMFTKVFHIAPSECPKASSFEMRDGLKMVYREMKDCSDFLAAAWDYLKSTANVECFVEWYLDDRKGVN